MPQVLNGAITSPPDTPPTQQDLFQSGPREPAFSASTYKPPALYPNKKPRTEPTANTRSSLSSPGLSSSTIETRPGCIGQRSSAPHGYSTPQSEHDSIRRPSLYQAPTLRQDQISPGAVTYQYTQSYLDDARSRPNGVAATAPHRSPESSSYSSSLSEVSYGQTSTTQSRAAGDYFPSSTDRYALPTSRRLSVAGQRGYAPPHPVEPSHSEYPSTRPAHYSLPMRDEAHEHAHYIERSRLQQQERYAKIAGYPEAQPTFFMPSHYDYQQGKTRKRSNLPKQSTEIMKTWFDQVRQEMRFSHLWKCVNNRQNITNPYPSEEQKAVFSDVSCKHVLKLRIHR